LAAANPTSQVDGVARLPSHQRFPSNGGIRIGWLAQIIQSVLRWAKRTNGAQSRSLQRERLGAPLPADGGTPDSALRPQIAPATRNTIGRSETPNAGIDVYMGPPATGERKRAPTDEPQQINAPDASRATDLLADHRAGVFAAGSFRPDARSGASGEPAILEPAVQETPADLPPLQDQESSGALPDDPGREQAARGDSLDSAFPSGIIERPAPPVDEMTRSGVEDAQIDLRPALANTSPESSERTLDLSFSRDPFAVGKDVADATPRHQTHDLYDIPDSGVGMVEPDITVLVEGESAVGYLVFEAPEQVDHASEDIVGLLETDGLRATEDRDAVPISIESGALAEEAGPGPAGEHTAEPGSTRRTGAPLKYRPRLREPTKPASSSGTARGTGEQAAGSLEAILQLSFRPGSWGIATSVLLTRADGMPEELDAEIGGERHSLLAIDDRLFEPVQLSDDAPLLSNGILAMSAAPPIRRWVRTTRDLHVFSERTGVSGFASVPRALIGQENVIVCKSELVGTAIDCAATTGSASLTEVTGPGIPDGWQCYRGFRPLHPAAFSGLDEKFLALNPLPNAAIELSGGIASARSAWVQGQPPIIRILGAEPAPGELTIDGAPASQSVHDGWIASGWDALGPHTIRFAGLSRTYEIVEIVEAWPAWRTSDAGPYSACGAKVSSAAQTLSFAVSGEACWLVGAAPGDIAFAAQASAGLAIATPAIRPVWALSPGRGGRPSLARAMPYQAQPQRPAAHATHDQVLHWCQLVRSAAPPRDTRERALWLEYRRVARGLRRRRR
jgi:hypothetical protein